MGLLTKPRLVRVVRIFRVLRFFSDLRIMVMGTWDVRNVAGGCKRRTRGTWPVGYWERMGTKWVYDQ